MEQREKLVNIWNEQFPNFPLTVADLKKPHAMTGVFLQVFNRLGIDVDAILSPPPEGERDDHTVYYWDLLPIINVIRVINHVVTLLKLSDKQSQLTIYNLLTPDAITSHAILLLLVNLIAFNENRLSEIAPHEQELFGKRDQVKALEESKNKLLIMLNEQAEEKSKRADRLEKIDQDILKFEEELELEKEAYNKDKKELDSILNENRQRKLILEQKTAQRDALLAEVARKRAMRVYDAEATKAQADQAAQSLQEANEKLNSLNTIVMQKENSLMNLQKIKPNLDTANNLVHEVMKLCESLKDVEAGDLETDSKEGEQLVLNTELSDLQSQLDEARAETLLFARKHAENQARRQLQKTHLESSLRETEENDKKSAESTKKSQQIIEDIKARTDTYPEDRKLSLQELADIKKSFYDSVKSYEDLLLNSTAMAQEKIEKKLRNRRRRE